MNPKFLSIHDYHNSIIKNAFKHFKTFKKKAANYKFLMIFCLTNVLQNKSNLSNIKC